MSTEQIRTACPRDCYDTCGLIAEVENGRLVRILGDPDHGATRGILCPKAGALVELVYHPERLKAPMVKRDGEWFRVSWNEALDIIAGKIMAIRDQFGTKGILHNWDFGSMGVLRALDQRFFNALGGATNPSGSLCSSAGIAALTYDCGRHSSHDPEDHLNSRLIVLWGKNPADTSVHLMPILREARERGARIILIDPQRTRTAQHADWHIAPRPGTDGALALAVAAEIIQNGWHDETYIGRNVHGFAEFAAMVRGYTPESAAEICDLPAETIRQLAREYGTTHPSAILIGFGMQRYTNGGAAVRAINALSAITGNIGVSGGGTSYSHRNTKQYQSLDAASMAPDRRFIPRARLGRGILESQNPSIQAIVVTRSNPVCQSPDSAMVRKAFERTPFVVVVDQFMTDTAEMANIVLPCTTFLEEEDLYFSYWHNWIAYGPKVIEPPGEARPDPWIFTELAKRCGIEKHFARTTQGWLEYALKPMARYGVTLERLQQGPMRHPQAPMVPWQDGHFDTPSGRFELYCTRAEQDGADPLPRFRPPVENTLAPIPGYPLQFLSTQPRLQTHSQLGNLASRQKEGGPEVRLHPDTARARGLEDGQAIEVVSPRGIMVGRLVFDAGLRKDLAATTNGHWVKDGGGANNLTADYHSDIGLQAALYDCLCDVRAPRITSSRS